MVEGKKEAPRYEVRIKRKVERSLRKLPFSVQGGMRELVDDLRELGRIRKDPQGLEQLQQLGQESVPLPPLRDLRGLLDVGERFHFDRGLLCR